MLFAQAINRRRAYTQEGGLVLMINGVCDIKFTMTHARDAEQYLQAGGH